jgi:hypothetical protein
MNLLKAKKYCGCLGWIWWDFWYNYYWRYCGRALEKLKMNTI